MAKSKTIDLAPSKVSDEHLKQLQGLVSDINAIQFEIGKLESQKHSFLHRLAGVQDMTTQLQTTLEKEYGTFDINIKDGTINRDKNE
tara:strand:+ start:203 stop:463 length:261 start_codon:yes stop_codon:yes gene_type:complete